RRQVPAPNNKSSKIASDVVHRWNQIAIDATGLDHTPVAPGENRVFGEQLGPGRASRAMAIVHIAIFDVVNALSGQYRSFTGIDSAPRPFSIRAAVAQAAHDTLAAQRIDYVEDQSEEHTSELQSLRHLVCRLL